MVKSLRTMVISYPSRKVKMTLWEGSEDEQTFEVKSLKRGKPYVQAYGIKYYLNDREIKLAKAMVNL